MIPTETFREILSGILDRSKAGDVRWTAHHRTRQSFLVRFPSSVLSINFHSPAVEPDYYVAVLEDLHGQTLASLGATEDGDDFGLLADLYSDAERNVVGWDKALGEIREQLAKPGPIGPKPLEDLEDDDIPF